MSGKGRRESEAEVDVAILGGGPAGASTAAYLARAGARCCVLEGERFPRPHVGESLVPSSTRVFRDLGFLETMESAGFPHKYGAAWTASGPNERIYEHDWDELDGARADRTNEGAAHEGAAREGAAHEDGPTIRFAERAQEGVGQPYTYHVDRGRFDQLLLQHAAQLGADVREEVRALRVDFEEGAPASVRWRSARGEGTTRARLIVDATGRRTLLGNQLRLRVRDEIFDQFAIHTWFEGYERDAWAKKPGMRDYIFVHFLPITNSWIWQIPISGTITSVGVVTQRKHFASARADREAFFWECVGSRPEVAERLRAATMVRPLTEEGDYSYAMRQITGDRWLMVGDAGRFVDPIFSTGVSIALNSARFAHGDVLRALEHGDLSRASFSRYEETLRRGTRNWYEFISVYYRLNVLFTYFITQKRYRLDVLQLLQGDVYEADEPPVLAKMREMVSAVERNPRHPWHALLNDLTSRAFSPSF